MSDIKIHSIIDKLNPNLRSIEKNDGKQRVREFYAMPPEDAYAILEAIAEIHGCADKLKLVRMNPDEKRDEEIAEDIKEERVERLSPFSFEKCGIPVGAELEFYLTVTNATGIMCTVVDEKHVSYQGDITSLSALASKLSGKRFVAGPRYFKYNGEWLNDIRRRLGV